MANLSSPQKVLLVYSKSHTSKLRKEALCFPVQSELQTPHPPTLAEDAEFPLLSRLR